MDIDIIQILEDKIGFKLRERGVNNINERGYILDNHDVVSITLSDIKNFKLDDIIDVLFEFKELRQLSLINSKITDIKSIKKLDQLNRINLSRNRISDVSPLKDFKQLTSLFLGQNLIDNIIQLRDLTNLKYLDLNNNQISNPFYLSNLKSLTKLYLDYNMIRNLDFLGELTNLIQLSLSNNVIHTIESLKYLKNLQIINLNHNVISDINSLTDLSNLKEVFLAGNSIKDISPLKNLNNLVHINLSGNGIESIIPIKNLRKIKILWLYDNRIKDISLVESFESLEQLSIAKNNISSVNFINKLLNLKVLRLNDNFLQDILSVNKLSQLIELDVSKNKITDISPIENLKHLERVILGENSITELPEWITSFDMEIEWKTPKLKGKYISFFNNPLIVPPIDIIKQGNETIKRYFEKIKDEGLDFIYEAKLILVGEGNAGKTSLQKRLLNEKTFLPKVDTRTRGIEIKDWNFKKEGLKSHVVHIWDFGGQDVYYPVHRFFITENSVFVLLSSTRQTHHNFDYWIPTIYQFGDRSPIIIGQTCHDGNRVPWNDLGVYVGNSNFNIIKTQEFPYYELNLPNKNEGLDKIKEIILNQIIGLPHYGKGVPKSWIIIRNNLAELSKDVPCITFDSFKEICRNSNNKSFANLISIKDCCKFFHDIGVILWYSSNEELKNWVILQPEWAMNAVYRIIDDESIQIRRGNILFEDFKRLWQDESYDDKHSILKKMLEIFKIAFLKKHKHEEYIIPARLLSIPHEKEWQQNESYLRLEYRYDFMPRGIVNQVSAELSRYIIDENEVWNNAVNFYLNNGTAACQVIEDFYYRKIIVKASGRDARGIIILVMNALNDITEGYKGVQPGIYVPCICASCKIAAQPTTFLYSKLMEWSEKRESAVVTCNESGNILSIEELLYNVGLPSSESKKIKSHMNKTVTLFLASSSELLSDREQFEIFINRENKGLNDNGVFIKLELWEDFIDAVSDTRLQNEYNEKVKECDIFVSLFFYKSREIH